MCTHLLLEAEGLADQVVVMDRGHVLVAGTARRPHPPLWPSVTVLVDAEDPTMLDRCADAPVRALLRAQRCSDGRAGRPGAGRGPRRHARRGRRAAAARRAAHADARRALLHGPAARVNRRRRRHSPIARADLRQLRESRDFWVPLAVIAGFMFIVVPAVML